MRTLHKSAWTLTLAALLVALVASPAGAAGNIAAMSAAPDGVVWQPEIGNYDYLVLTVAGPGGDYRQEFKAGVAPSFSLFDADGYLVPDGSYTWELRMVPAVDAAARADLAAARAEGDDTMGDRLRAVGALPEVTVQSGYFRVAGGALVVGGGDEEGAGHAGGGAAHVGGEAMVPMPQFDQVIADDLIAQMSLCVGVDCVNGESFGFDTIRLKENNLRIKFQDTSTGSFPSEDWQLTANDSTNGGANRFSIESISTPRIPFTIVAGAPNNSLFVDAQGDIGLNTSTPVVELHIKDGDTPTIRLEQDGSSGFTAQTWDIAGNETNFFVRDVTNGSLLPFKIRPTAPNNSLYIDTDGDIGFNTASPGTLSDGGASQASLHILRSDGDASILVQDTNSTVEQRLMLELVNNGDVFFRQRNSSTGQFVDFNLVADEMRINFGTGAAGPELRLTSNGDLIILGGYTPDYVFEPDYPLMPIAELADFVDRERHLPNVPNAAEVKSKGLNVNTFPMRLLEKIEELTLYTIDQQKTIDALHARLEKLEETSAPVVE